MKIDLVIFAAMPEEMVHLLDIFSVGKRETIKLQPFSFTVYDYQGRSILLACTGIGLSFAASVVSLVVQQFNPDYIFMTGTCGAIDAELNIRDVVIIESAYEAELQTVFKAIADTPFAACLTHPLNHEKFPLRFPADAALLKLASEVTQAERITIGAAVSSDAFPAPLDLYDAIKANRPQIIDMETAAFYQAAWLLKVPALAVRGVSNKLDDSGKDNALADSDIAGSSSAAAAVLLQIIDALPKQAARQKSAINHFIEKYHLQPHIEGGLYVRSYQSQMEVLCKGAGKYNNEARWAGTAIYYLLQAGEASAWHALTSDEIWHYYKGSTVRLYMIDETGNLTTHLLGDAMVNDEAQFQVIVPGHTWMSAVMTDEGEDAYAMMGCTVSPGFDFKDYKLADKAELIKKFPQHEELIQACK